MQSVFLTIILYKGLKPFAQNWKPEAYDYFIAGIETSATPLGNKYLRNAMPDKKITVFFIRFKDVFF